jgi:hypothetical protein
MPNLTGNNKLDNKLDKYYKNSGYRNTNIRMGETQDNYNDLYTFALFARRENITNDDFYINTDFDPDTIGFNITTPNTPVNFSIASTSINDTITGSGAEIIRIFGLDSNWNPLEEDIILNGQTAVNTINQFIRINDMLVLRSNNAANDTKNEGYISVTDSTDTFSGGIPQTRIYCSIGLGKNKASHGIYSIRAGYSAISTNYKEDTDATTTKTVIVRNEIKFLNTPSFILTDLNFTVGGTNYILDGLLNIPEKSDIILSSIAGTNTTIGTLTIWWTGILKKNSKFQNAQRYNNSNLLY